MTSDPTDAGTQGPSRAGYRLLIALLGKGSVNNLHHTDVVDAFRARGVEVAFLVREGDLELLRRLPECRYLTFRLSEESGAMGFWRAWLRYVRSLYANRRIDLMTKVEKQGLRRRLTYGAVRVLARSRGVMRALLSVEARLYRHEELAGVDPGDLDQLLLQAIGTRDSEIEARVAWWARRHGKSIVHVVSNYDNLSSKGYRGLPVDHVLVWGPVMRADAVALHGIEPERIRVIGALRYDRLARERFRERTAFLESIGLDPAKRTILFAGSQAEYHYFEMLQAFDELRGGDDRFQLVLRIYPDKLLMASPYMAPLIGWARTRPGVYVSIADPHASVRGESRGLPEIEQTELWHLLRHSDVVVNLYSTMALEACLFDTPVIYLWYHQKHAHFWLRPPLLFDHGLLLHNRKMREYGAVPLARDRRELLALIREAVADPARRRAERAHAAQQELGPLDGGVVGRLIDACVEAYQTDGRPGSGSRDPAPPGARVPAAVR